MRGKETKKKERMFKFNMKSRKKNKINLITYPSCINTYY